MAAALKLFTQSHLEAELSAEVVLRCLDYDNDGVVDVEAFEALQEDCAATVLARLAPVMPTLPMLAETWQSDLTDVPLRLRKLAVRVAVAELAEKFPTTVRRDFEKIWRLVNGEFDRIRKDGLDSLGLGGEEPEHASNIGGTVWAGGDDKTVAPEMVFNGPNSMGDF